MKKIHHACLPGLLLIVAPAISFAQQTERVGIAVTGEKGVTASIKDFDTASRSYKLQPHHLMLKKNIGSSLIKKENRLSLRLAKLSSPVSILENTNALATTQTIHSNFLATGYAVENGIFVAPYCMGDVGPSQVMVAVNSTLKVYNKNSVCDAAQTTTTGASSAYLAAPVYSVNLNVLFSSVAVGGTLHPRIRYDRLSQRWFVVVMDLRTLPNRCCIAVSSGPVITGLSSFTFFSFAADGGSPVPTSYIGCLLDAPTLGG